MPDEPTVEAQTARLIDAVLAVGAELELPLVLRRIIEAAVDLVDAKYGALGVLSPGGGALQQLVHVGMDERTVRAIGALPTFCGVLGVLIEEGRPVRLEDIGTHPKSLGFPPGHPTMHSFLGVPIRVRDTVYGNLYLADKTTAAGFTAHDERVATALAGAAGVAVQNARLFDQARLRESWLQAASDVTRQLMSGADEQQVFTAIAEHVRRLCDATDSGVALPSGDGTLTFVAGVGELGRAYVGVTLDPATSMAVRVFRDGVAMVLDEVQVSAAQRTSNPPRVGPSLLVPLAAAGHTRGVLTASRRPGAPPFQPDVLPAMQSFAEQAELAWELAARRRDSEALSLLADRDRIARNLHDLVIQRLFATGMALESAANLLAVNVAEAGRRIRGAVSDLDDTIREIRTTVFALQQPADRAWSLRARIIEVVDDATVALGFTPSVQFDGLIDTMVGEQVVGHLLAVLSEALSNVARHASATSAAVLLSVHDQLVLQVSDNGIGLPPSGRRSGLANLAARANELGGRLDLSAAGPGTILRWSVPLH